MKTDLMTMGLLLLSGALSGLLFDFYRMLRRDGRWNRLVTFCGDLLFSLLVLGVLLFFFRKANFLEFRLYLFIASLAGLALYLLVASHRVKVFFARLISLIKRISKAVFCQFRAVFMGIYSVLHFILDIPYSILRWFGLLIYRIGEAILRGFSGNKSNAQRVPLNGEQKQKRQQFRKQKHRLRARKNRKSGK